MKKTTKVVLGSAMTMAMCASLITGATLALFSSEDDVNIAITSAKVDVTATIDDEIKTYSYQKNSSGEYVSTEMTPGEFVFGKAALEDDKQTLKLDNIVPGDKAELTLNIKNESTIAVKYQIMITVSEDNELYKSLKMTVGDEGEFVDSALSSMKLSKWKELQAESSVEALPVSVELPYDTTNVAEQKTCTLTLAVQAVQANSLTTDPVPVDPADPATANIVPIYSLAEFKTFRDSVNRGDSYVGKTVQLLENIALNNEEWEPIGTASYPFLGNFDGQGHTISNLTINATSSSYVALFGYVATWKNEVNTRYSIKDLTIKNANVTGSSWSAAFVGNGTTYLDLENLKLTGHVEITSNKQGAAGIIAYSKYVGSMNNLTVETDDTSFVQSIAVDTNYDVGGIVGWMDGQSSFIKPYTNLTSNIEVRGGYRVGGIVGLAQYVAWENCTSTGNIVIIPSSARYADPDMSGGIAGYAAQTSEFVNCHYTGTISSETEELTYPNYGLVGESGEYATIKSSSVERTVTDGLTLYAEWDESGLADQDHITYRIYNAEGMVKWAELLNAEETDTDYVELMKDIDLTGINWVAPSSLDLYFNGNNHTISNVTCVPAEGEDAYWRAGLFGSASGKIYDLTLINVIAKGAQAGALMGHTHGITLNNISIGGKIDITYDSRYTTEDCPGIGFFFGAVGHKIQGTGLKITSDCVASFDLAQMPFDNNNTTAKSQQETAIAQKLYTYASWEINNDYFTEMEEVTVEEGAQINVRNGEELYTLYTPAQLLEFAESVQNGHTYKDETVKLYGDVDLKGTTWTPVGTNEQPFAGNFDGGNHTIDHLTFDDEGTSYAGFFGRVSGDVKDLKFTNADVTFSTYGGVLAGYATGSISGVTVEDSTVNGTGYSDGNFGLTHYCWAGILTGYATGLISDCKLTGSTVNGVANFVGGITGQGRGDFETITVDGCEINGYWKTGGIVGQWDEGTHHMSDVLVQNTTIRGTSDTSAMAGVCHYGDRTFTNCQVRGCTIEAAKDGNGTLNNVGGFIGGLIEGTGNDKVLFNHCNIFGGDNVLTIRATRIESAGGFIGGMYSGTTTSTATLTVTITDKVSPENQTQNFCNIRLEAESFGDNIGIFAGDFSNSCNDLTFIFEYNPLCGAKLSNGTNLPANKAVGWTGTTKYNKEVKMTGSVNAL